MLGHKGWVSRWIPAYSSRFVTENGYFNRAIWPYQQLSCHLWWYNAGWYATCDQSVPHSLYVYWQGYVVIPPTSDPSLMRLFWPSRRGGHFRGVSLYYFGAILWELTVSLPHFAMDFDLGIFIWKNPVLCTILLCQFLYSVKFLLSHLKNCLIWANLVELTASHFHNWYWFLHFVW